MTCTGAPDHPQRRDWVWVAATVLLSSALVVWQSSLSIFVGLTDGAEAAAIAALFTVAGTWFVPALRLRDLSIPWHLLLGAAFGLGGGALAVLLVGLCGALTRIGVLTLLVVVGVAAVARIAALTRRAPKRAPPLTNGPRSVSERPIVGSHNAFRSLWLLLCPFVALSILAATAAPGFLWTEEGRGYDVLEYHLQLPREYSQQQAITYLPHNVYAAFPSNVEMLYTVFFVLRNGDIEAAGPAKMLNLILGALVVFAAWVIGREHSPAAARVTAVMAGSFGYLTYLSGVAYTENGMLFFAMTALAALVRGLNRGRFGRWCAIAGLSAGLACGCKYTAVLLVAAPMAAAILCLPPMALSNKLRHVAVFGLGALATLAPWLLKNLVLTGNPVFPLAGDYFPAAPPGWGAAESQHFAVAHAPAPDETSLPARLTALWTHLPGDHWQRYGPMLFLLPLLAVLRTWRDPTTRLCVIIVVMQVLFWMFATHLYARFAVVVLLPLAALAGRSVVVARTTWSRRFLFMAIVAGAGWNAYFVCGLYRTHYFTGDGRVEPAGAYGFFRQGMGLGHEHLATVNGELPQDAYVLMLGDARAFYMDRRVDYCVVFNRSPFVEQVQASQGPAEVIGWLQQRGYTHVLVNWSEITRLRRSRYGFPKEVNPALFGRLVDAGLRHVETTYAGQSPTPVADLFAVPRRSIDQPPRDGAGY